ncbi:abn-ts, partial [Symbiodinium microadriaticum]
AQSRRDEVWERKRQAFLSRQNGDGASAVSRPSMASAAPRSQARPSPLGGADEALSRLVREGYPETVGAAPQGTPTTRQMYGMQAYAGQ